MQGPGPIARVLVEAYREIERLDAELERLRPGRADAETAKEGTSPSWAPKAAAADFEFVDEGKSWYSRMADKRRTRRR